MPGRALQPTPSLRGVDILLPMVCYTKEARGKSPWASCLFHASMEPPVGCLAYVVRDMPTPTCQLRVEKHHHFVDIIFMHRMFARQFTSVRSHLVSTFERIIPQCQVLQNVYSNPLLCPPPSRVYLSVQCLLKGQGQTDSRSAVIAQFRSVRIIWCPLSHSTPCPPREVHVAKRGTTSGSHKQSLLLLLQQTRQDRRLTRSH